VTLSVQPDVLILIVILILIIVLVLVLVGMGQLVSQLVTLSVQLVCVSRVPTDLTEPSVRQYLAPLTPLSAASHIHSFSQSQSIWTFIAA